MQCTRTIIQPSSKKSYCPLLSGTIKTCPEPNSHTTAYFTLFYCLIKADAISLHVNWKRLYGDMYVSRSFDSSCSSCICVF